MNDEVRHFLLVFDHRSRQLVDLREFVDFDEAITAYDAAEVRHGAERHIEVVLFGAGSIDEVKATHPGFFRPPGTSAGDRARILRDAGWRDLALTGLI